MPAAFPPGVASGTILRHPRYYLERESGQLRPKFMVALAVTPGGDIVFRVLTSRAHGRPENPPCSHGAPYPSFYLGFIGGAHLTAKSWLDLRRSDDYDGDALQRELATGDLARVGQLDRATLQAAMDCAAAAPDTTIAQERAIRDQLSTL
jgi:hypothetical protein